MFYTPDLEGRRYFISLFFALAKLQNKCKILFYSWSLLKQLEKGEQMKEERKHKTENQTATRKWNNQAAGTFTFIWVLQSKYMPNTVSLSTHSLKNQSWAGSWSGKGAKSSLLSLHGAFLVGSFGNTVKSKGDTKQSNAIDLKPSFQVSDSQCPLKFVFDAVDGNCLASACLL